MISRSHLLAALVAIPALPVRVFGQDAAGGRGQTRDTTPLVPPFEPTGWKTVWLDHLNYQCVDYKKAAAFYATLMGWKVRSDDGKQAVLDIGDWGGVIIRGGYVAPPPPPTPPPSADAAAGDAGRGAGGGGRGGRGGGGPRTPVKAVWDSFCWGIEPWDTKKVEAELKARGLAPVADHQGKDFQSFHVKDPDGFNLQISDVTHANRLALPDAVKPTPSARPIC